ncbi:MAG: hopanoid-associated sugar epimerase [Rhodoplanes sp.]
MNAERVLVTGAAGFVGSAIATVLRNAGFRVRTLVRATSARANLHPDDELAIGDLRDRNAVAAALSDVRYLFHAAADYRLWAPDPSDIYRNNVETTGIVMTEAQRCGVERIVYTSSVATIDLKHKNPADETDRLAESDAVGAYKRSKVAAERLVEDMAQRGLPAVIVNPSAPIGPRDVRPTPTGRIIVEAASGRMPGYVDTGLNLVHVDDVAAGHLLALRHGEIGERYILGGENVFLRTMLADIAEMVGRPPPRLKIPVAVTYPVAFVAEFVARFTKREPFVTLDSVRLASHRMFFDDTKARRALGYVSRPYREAIADAIAWFRAGGYLR